MSAMRTLFVITVLLSAGLVRILGGLDMDSWGPAARVVAAASGMALALLLPGLALWPLWRHARRLEPDRFVAWTAVVLLSLAAHTVTHTVVILLGGEAGFWPMWAGATLWTVIGGVLWRLLVSRQPAPADLWPSARTAARFAVGAVAITAFALVTSPPRLVEEADYFPEELFDYASRLDYSLPRADPPIITFGHGWQDTDEAGRLLLDRAGVVLIGVPDGTSLTFQLKLLLHNTWPVPQAVRLTLDGKPLSREALLAYDAGWRAEPRGDLVNEVYLHPPYVPTRDPRNAPAALRLLCPTLTLAPGTHTLRLEVRPFDPHTEPRPRAKVVDLSLLSADDFYARLRRHVFVGDTGDIRETLDFIQHFRTKWLQHASSYAGDTFDGGGPTSISDEPPGHHFVGYLAQVFCGESITSLSWLYLAELWLIWALGLHLLCRGGATLCSWQAVPLLLGLFVQITLCRFGVESNAPDTLLLLLLLALLAALLSGRRLLAVLLGALAFYVHIPAPQATLLVGLAAAMALRQRAPLITAGVALAAMAGVLLTRLALLTATVGFDRSLYSGQAIFLGGNRLTRLKELLCGSWEMVPELATRALDLHSVITVTSGGALVFFGLALLCSRTAGRLRPDPTADAALLFGLLFALAFGLVDAVRAHHLGPILLPAVLGTTRRVAILARPLPRLLLWAFFVAALLGGLVYLSQASPDPTGTFGTFHLKYWIY